MVWKPLNVKNRGSELLRDSAVLAQTRLQNHLHPNVILNTNRRDPE